MRSRLGTRLQFAAVVWAAASGAMALLGCSSFGGEDSGKVFVPEQATARDQYWFARRAQLGTMILTEKPAERQKQLDSLRAAYQMVVDRFPDDPEYTPESKAQLCEIELIGYKQPKKALALANALIEEHSNDEYIDARARLLRGRALEAMGDRLAAQKTYKECKDLHNASKDKNVKSVVQEANKLYNRLISLEPDVKDKKKR